MRITLSFLVYSVAALAITKLAISQTTLSLPGCEPVSEVRKTLDDKLNLEQLSQMKLAERDTTVDRVVRDLMAKYPREVQPGRFLIDYFRWEDPDQLPTVRELFQKQAEQNPNDPLALDLAARALWHHDTESSIRMLERAKERAPDWPWPFFDLAEIFSKGRHVDRKRAAENLGVFFSMCPGITDVGITTQWVLDQLADVALQAKVAADLRSRLLREIDPTRLREYQTLWSLEFRSRPPQQHGALRKQVAEDVDRLKRLNRNPDAKWLVLLITGQKQAEAPAETIKTLEDQVLREFPNSNEASSMVVERWRNSHQEPQDPGDVAAWKEYNAAYQKEIKLWIRNHPDDTDLQELWFNVIQDDESIPVQERVRAMERVLERDEEYGPPMVQAWAHIGPAEFLLKYKLQPERALQLLHRAQIEADRELARIRQDDDLSAEMSDELKREFELGKIAGLTLKAAKLSGRPEEGQPLKPVVEGPMPADRNRLSPYWENRARLAELEGRKADSLIFYQLALQKRTTTPKLVAGKLNDELVDDARSLWTELGGTDSGWQMWIKSSTPKAEELADGHWEKPKQELPSFVLDDLSGKTWRLKDLAGKAVLIGVWATWCGPCQRELPHVQKLYESLKARPDLQIITFNVDEDLGLVAPYLKEKGYTFPVLPAHNLVNGMFDLYGIPQAWIIDSKGKWVESQLGFLEDPAWGNMVARKLESATAPK